MKKIAALALGLTALGFGSAAAGPLDSRLFDAVRDGNHAEIRALLARHANVNERLYDKSTVLSWAVDRQDEESVQLLLAAGAAANLADAEGATPIILACQGGNPDIARRLLAAGANAKQVRKDGTGVLSLCAGSSSPDIVEKLIAAGAPADAANPEGQTPLMFAAARGKIENMQVLIRHGVNVNKTTSRGFSPLFFAVKSGVAEATPAIVAAGGDVAYVAPDGTNALHLALFARNIPAAKYLVEHGADLQHWDLIGRQPLHAAVEMGDTDLVKALLSKGADANGLTKTAFRAVPHQTDAFVAGRSGTFIPASTDGDWKPKTVYMALDGGVLPKAPPPATPLLLAAKAGSTDIMKVLVAGGAKPDLKSPNGMSVLLAAASSGNLEAVKYALEIDPNINETAGGTNVMQMALSNPRGSDAEAIMQYLADHGAPLDGKNERGQTTAALAERATPGMKALYDKLVNARALKATR